MIITKQNIVYNRKFSFLKCNFSNFTIEFSDFFKKYINLQILKNKKIIRS